MKKRVLVTGGAGFIGSHIVDDLVKRGYEVAVLDNFSTGRLENLSESANKVEIFKADITDRERVFEIFESWKPSIVSHQAAQASVKISMERPDLDAMVNVVGGVNVLDAAVAVGVSYFIFASTGGAIYGEVPEGQAATEEWIPQPKSPYAAAKASFELYLKVYRAQFGLPFVVLRYANVYGPRQDPFGEAGVVAIFTERLIHGKAVTVFARRHRGDTGCVRDYVFVDDVVTVHNIMLSEKREGVFNVSTGTGKTTMEVLETIASSLNRRPQIHFDNPRAGDLEVSVLDNSALKTLFSSWTDFPTGIQKTVKWFLAHSR
ncbi:MAG: SDR family NAD(P)-dependent oxidoreductase [Syntrophobacterales bacterium]|nr:SDR family NAD(P)-dependent oxidoreductase [Syntrophobacterales bacterium]